MKKLLLAILLAPSLLFAQKKMLDHSSYDEWRRIDDRIISNDGKYIAYSLKNNAVGNKEAVLLQHDGTEIIRHDRASSLALTNNSSHLIFKVSPDIFKMRDLKRKKTKDKDLPKDTLAIYSIGSKQLTKIRGLKSFKVPKEWNDYLIYLYEPPKDTTEAGKKAKKRSKKNGYDLVVRNLTNDSEYTFSHVLDYKIAEEGAGVSLVSTGNDTTTTAGIYRFDFQALEFKPVFRSKGKFHKMAWSKNGSNFTFVSDTDTTKALLRDYHLHLWSNGSDSSRTLVSNKDLNKLHVNHQFQNYFSESGNRLFFETIEFPILQDTALLDEEIVKVEVWSYNDPRLHTQQKIDKKDDVKEGYLSYYDLKNKKWVQLGNEQLSSVSVSDEGDGNTARFRVSFDIGFVSIKLH